MNPSRTRWVIVAVGLLAIAIAVWAIPGDPRADRDPVRVHDRRRRPARPAHRRIQRVGRDIRWTPGARRAGEQRRDLVGRDRAPDRERHVGTGDLDPRLLAVGRAPGRELRRPVRAACALARPVAPGRRDVPRALQPSSSPTAQSGSADARPGLQDVLDQATTDPAFKFAHTDPNQSTSGLSVVLSEFQLAGGVERERVDAQETSPTGETRWPGTSSPSLITWTSHGTSRRCGATNSDRSSPMPRTCRRPPTSSSSAIRSARASSPRSTRATLLSWPTTPT